MATRREDAVAKEKKSPSRFWAFVSVGVGGLLLLMGFGASAGYLGLPAIIDEVNIFGTQLGQMAAIFLGLGGGTLALFHGLGSLRGEASSPFRLPPAHFLVIAFALVVALGNTLLIFEVAANFLFPFLFLLGAALPLAAVLAWSSQRLGWPVSWRQASLSFVSGATLSVLVTIFLSAVLAVAFFFLVIPVELLSVSIEELLDLFGGGGFLERFFFSPYVIVLLFITVLQAPIPEEFAKALGPGFMLNRIGSERQAFMLGLASGAGFAVLENMMYEGIYALWSGWTWGGVTVLRAIGSVLHPLCTGIIVLALFRSRQRQRGWAGRIAGAYLLAVILHTLWNGGFEALLLMTGLDHYSGIGPAFNVYGESIAVILAIYLVIYSAALWWLLARIIRSLAGDEEREIIPMKFSMRSVALWAAVSLLVILPVGSAIGPAWGGATDVFAAGPPATPTPEPEPTAIPVSDSGSEPELTSSPSPISTPLPIMPVTTLPGARIAFQSSRYGVPHIYLLEGENLSSLTDNHGSGRNPSWSTDGTEIVFDSNTIVIDNSEIFVMDADGSNLRQLTDSQGLDEEPAWSPDGEHIVFVSQRDGKSELYIMNSDGSDQIPLTNDGIDKSDPSWSPDGQFVVYAAGHSGAFDIYILEMDSREVTQFTSNENNERGPVFSPGQEYIVYASNSGNNVDIYIKFINSGQELRLIAGESVDNSPNWSPDGRYIAYSSSLTGGRDIYAFVVDTRKVIRLTDLINADTDPAWSP